MHGESFELMRSGADTYFSRAEQTYSWAGTVGGLGPVELVYPTERSVGASGVCFRVSVSGPHLAESSYLGLLYGGRPSLAEGELLVAGEPGQVSRNAWGLTRRGRGLRIEAWGRRYDYVEVGGKRRHELRREQIRVRMARSSWHIPQSISGAVHGPADAVDVGLAILLEGVNTRNLSVPGALLSAPGRLLSRLGG